MEVHHPHHIMHKKKWKEYLLEFLMLFLAVFLGFTAENIREHQIENKRAKQYISSLYQDLKEDTTTLSTLINFYNHNLSDLGTISDCFDTISKNINATSSMLKLFKASQIILTFQSTDRTISQLASAGGYRLLEPQDADSIISYLKLYKQYKDFESTQLQAGQDNLRITFSTMIRFTANYQMRDLKTGWIKDSMPVNTPLFSSEGPSLINKYFNDLFRYYNSFWVEIRLLNQLKNKATRLIHFYGNKYHLE